MIYTVVVERGTVEGASLKLSSLRGTFELSGVEYGKTYVVLGSPLRVTHKDFETDIDVDVTPVEPRTIKLELGRSAEMVELTFRSRVMAAHNGDDDGGQQGGPRPFRILALNGGGMRGVFVGVVASMLEALFGRPLYEVFDLIVGTSSGAIVGTGASLESGMPWKSRADETTEGILLYGDANVVHKRGYLTGYLSDTPRLETAYMRYVGEQTMADVVKTELGLCALDMTVGRPVLITKDNYPALKIWQGVRASSAAVPYFEPMKLPDGHVMFDGGFVANNPAVFALAHAREKHGWERSYSILHIGSGRAPPPDLTGCERWTGVSLAKMMLETVSDRNNGLWRTYLETEVAQSEGRLKYVSLDPGLTTASYATGDYSPANLAALAQDAYEYVTHTDLSAVLENFFSPRRV